jgi:hypothetical protein
MVQSPSNRLKSYWPKSTTGEGETVTGGQSKADEWSHWLAQCMAERPALTLATAAVVGLALGWIIKRR